MNGAEVEEAGMALGLTTFDSLRAEDETAWLARCFVPPRDFEYMIGSRSLVIFGAEGNGKTALYQALLDYNAGGEEGKPIHLPVSWQPELPEVTQPEHPSGLASVRRQIEAIFRECVTALAEFVLCWPAAYRAAPMWARERYGWFIQMYGTTDLRLRLGPQIEVATSTGREALNDLLNQKPSIAPIRPMAPERAAVSFGQALQSLGVEGIWVLFDSPLIWSSEQEMLLASELTAFLSTLPLFELPHFTFKLIVPARLEKQLVAASGVRRRRLDRFYLTWEPAQLQQLVEARLAATLGRPEMSIKDLCNAKTLLSWLERTGGESPRAWLKQIRPLVASYQAQGGEAPLTKKEWQSLRRNYAPWLYFDQAQKKITIGSRTITAEALSDQAYNLFTFLYERQEQIVSKAELYYRLYRNLDHVPHSAADEAYEFAEEYEGMIDTAIWRLRKVIEPDPGDPLFITSVRGHGVRLERCV